jgi:hypothetical protein
MFGPVDRRRAEVEYPGLAVLEGAHSELSSPVLHGDSSLVEGTDNVGIGDAGRSRDDPRDKACARSPLRPGRVCPNLHACVHDRSRVFSVIERTKSDELREDAFHVEAAGLSVTKGGEKWAACLALAHLLELNRIES